jgi:hypothetical protein
MNETPTPVKNTTGSVAVAASRESSESWLSMVEPAGTVSLEVSHADSNGYSLDLETVYTIVLDLPLKVKTGPIFDGNYSKVFIGQLDDKMVCLHYTVST